MHWQPIGWRILLLRASHITSCARQLARSPGFVHIPHLRGAPPICPVPWQLMKEIGTGEWTNQQAQEIGPTPQGHDTGCIHLSCRKVIWWHWQERSSKSDNKYYNTTNLPWNSHRDRMWCFQSLNWPSIWYPFVNYKCALMFALIATYISCWVENTCKPKQNYVGTQFPH